MKLIFIIFFLTTFLFAEDNSRDSLRTYKMNDVVVVGNRFANEIRLLPIAVQVLDSSVIQQSNGNSVADVLKHQAGVFIKSYGGNAALQSISLRGMSSDYTLILLNGKRYTTFQIGTVDLGIFPLGDVERIELLNGGNSALYGADAVGGVVNIVTKKPRKEFHSMASLTFGSFGLRSFGAEIGGSIDEIPISLSIKTERANNNYDFAFRDGVLDTTLQRGGADYLLNTFSLATSTSICENFQTSFSIRHNDAERGQPSAVTSSFQNNRARIHDKDLFIQWNSDFKPNEALFLALDVSLHYNNQTYKDPNIIIGNIPLNSYYLNRIWNVTQSLQYFLNDENKFYSGIEAAHSTISSNEVYSRERNQLSFYISTQNHVTFPLDVFLYPAIRYDNFNDVQGYISPKIGISIGVENLPSVRVRASYGKNIRIPTFNDLYWINGGNPSLNSERSISADGGFVCNTSFYGNYEFEANYFSIKTKDKIVWRPISTSSWSPVNISAVSSSGVELHASAKLFEEIFNIHYAHTFTNSIKTSLDFSNDITQGKKLALLPEETASLSTGIKINVVSFNILYAFTSFRYLQDDNNPRFVLPSFEKVDANISTMFYVGSFSFRLKIEVNNIFNEAYTVMPFYPTPLRNYAMNSEFHF